MAVRLSSHLVHRRHNTGHVGDRQFEGVPPRLAPNPGAGGEGPLSKGGEPHFWGPGEEGVLLEGVSEHGRHHTVHLAHDAARTPEEGVIVEPGHK